MEDGIVIYALRKGWNSGTAGLAAGIVQVFYLLAPTGALYVMMHQLETRSRRDTFQLSLSPTPVSLQSIIT